MAKKRNTRLKPGETYVLVRGSRRNPVPMAKSKRKSAFNKMTAFLRSHFPGAKVRVQKVKI